MGCWAFKKCFVIKRPRYFLGRASIYCGLELKCTNSSSTLNACWCLILLVVIRINEPSMMKACYISEKLNIQRVSEYSNILQYLWTSCLTTNVLDTTNILPLHGLDCELPIIKYYNYLQMLSFEL